MDFFFLSCSTVYITNSMSKTTTFQQIRTQVSLASKRMWQPKRRVQERNQSWGWIIFKMFTHPLRRVASNPLHTCTVVPKSIMSSRSTCSPFLSCNCQLRSMLPIPLHQQFVLSLVWLIYLVFIGYSVINLIMTEHSRLWPAKHHLWVIFLTVSCKKSTACSSEAKRDGRIPLH